MRARDVFIVGVAILCCIIGWSQEGSVNFQRSFKIPLGGDFIRSLPPKPIVIDVDGKGHIVFVAAPSPSLLVLYKTEYTHRNLENVFIPISSHAEIHLSGEVVSLGAGSLIREAPAHYVAVLTNDYRLTLYNIKGVTFHRQWEVVVLPLGSRTDLRHASIAIVPERVEDGDLGMVVVAVKALDAAGVELTFFASFNGKNGEARWRYFSDAGNEMDDVLREINGTSHERSNHPESILAVRSVADGGGATIHVAPSPPVGRRFEKPWTTFREAVIAALPHHFAHPWDAQLRPHVLYPAKAHQKQHRKPANKKTLLHQSGVIRMDADDYGDLGDKFNLWVKHQSTLWLSKNKPALWNRTRKPANAFVYHSESGVEVVHMFTGNTITSVQPLKSYSTYYADINDDYHIDSVSTQIGPRVDIHSENGVDHIADCLGIIRTGIPVTEHDLFNATICDTQGFFGNLDLIHHFVDSDIRGEEAPHVLNTLELMGSKNIVSSTTQSVMPLVVQCHVPQGSGFSMVARYAVFMIDSGLVTCVNPSRRRVLWRVQTNAVFDSTRPKVLQGNHYEAGGSRLYPHLMAYSLFQSSVEDDVTYVGGGRNRYDRTEPYVLAVGEETLAVINTKTGKVTRSISLAEGPTAPVIIADFNGDGTNDIIMVTRTHIYGFVGSTQASSETLTALMMLMVAMLLILFFVRELGHDDDGWIETVVRDQPGPHSFKRSTD